LVAEHEVDYDDFLHFVHDFAVESYVAVDSDLESMLADLALRRVVYTNATVEYGWRVLRALGIADYFERIIGVETVGLRNKPYRDAYEQALAMLNTEGPQCIMVEDSARNLEPAKALGMKTILLSKNGAGEAAQAYRDSVDFVIEDVLEVKEVVQRLLEG
jgi:putative hydrolase of the HAD superfamily